MADRAPVGLLTRPGLYAVTWFGASLAGWGLVGFSVTRLDAAAWQSMGPALFMIAALLGLAVLRPIVMTRMPGNPVSLTLTFVFASMYLWGPFPALLLMAAAVTAEELLGRRPWWKLIFNVGQYTLSIFAAWLVLAAAGAQSSPFDVAAGLTGADLPWLLVSWAVYHVVNLALVAGVAAEAGQGWWESFTDEFWLYTVSTMAVLALSPLIAVAAVADERTFWLLPLLVVPLLAVQQAVAMSRAQEHAALHDPLTGLPNRVLLHDRITQALARRTRTGFDVVVLFADVDRFKVINDGLGHAVGDHVLVELGHRLQVALRPGDSLGRFGGDEFVVVCEDVTGNGVDSIVARVRDALATPFLVDGQEVAVTVSVGVAVATDGDDPARLLRDADAAMYRAKAAGRDRAVVFDAVMHRDATHRLQLEAELRHALAREQLRLHYQPILDLADQSPVGFESLLRWEHPDLGLLGPDAFVPLAEETGLIVPLGAWVARQALTHVATWRRTVDGCRHLTVAVNLSAVQLEHSDIIDTMREALAVSGIDPDAVCLEVTESVLLNERGNSRATLVDLRDLGVRIAIDDFGVGYSSLAYLTRLPIDAVKIDRSFVADLDDGGPTATAVVEAITSLARALRLQTIAEGVETAKQRDMLRPLGVEHGQGFLWSPPIPHTDVPRWLAQHRAGHPLTG